MRLIPKNVRPIAAVAVAATLMASCGDDTPSSGNAAIPVPATASVAADDGGAAFPLTLENCDEDVTFEAAPRRIVTLNQTAAEILIHLGVGDRVIGTGYEIDEVPDDIAEEYNAIPVLSGADASVPFEALLEVQPDFVYSSFASFLSATVSGERAELHELGIPTYLTEFDCTFHEAIDDPSFEVLFDEYRDLGDILGEPDAAARLIAEQKAVLADGMALAEKIEGEPSLMWFYSTYEGTPYAAGPGGLPQHVTELLGARNIFDDASTKWPEVSWDEVAARNPDVIILADLTRGVPGDTAAEKIEILKSDPLTSQLDAVVNDRFIVVPGRIMDPSHGSVFAVPLVAQGLLDLD